MGEIVDMWFPILPIPEIASHLKKNFAKEMLGYLRVFHKVPAKQESLEMFVDMLAGGAPLEDVVSGLDEAGIGRALITGFNEKTSVGSTMVPNEIVLKSFQAYPERFIPFAGIDIFTGMDGVRELVRLVEDDGFQGLSLRPFMIGLTADDRRYYPFYAKCVELDIPMSIHASANWSHLRSNEFGRPGQFDTVACDFPELKLILSHGGYPWILESCMLAWKHENVYLELAAHRPKYMTKPGTGWEPLFTYGDSVIKDKILWGSGAFLLGHSPQEIIAEFRELPLKPDTITKWLGGNAAKLLAKS